MSPKRKENSQTAPSRGPIKVLHVDDVSASVFAREHVVRGETMTFYSVTFTRWYRDAHGQSKYVKSFSLDDLGKVVAVAQQADAYIRGLLDPEQD